MRGEEAQVMSDNKTQGTEKTRSQPESGAGGWSQETPPPGASSPPPPPKRSGARWVVTCLVVGCLGVLLIAGSIGGCLGCAAWKAGKAVADQAALHSRLTEFHAQLLQHAEANDGAFPAEFDVGAPAEPDEQPFVYVPGLRKDMPGKFVLVYRRGSLLGSGTVMAVTIAGSVTIAAASEFDELLAAQKKAMEGMKQGGAAAEKAREEFEKFIEAREAERRASETARPHHRHHIDWD
jgi:hypothetical protein